VPSICRNSGFEHPLDLDRHQPATLAVSEVVGTLATAGVEGLHVDA
jgi:hypothetical protein